MGRKVIFEYDGVIVDPFLSYWSAYEHAANAVNTAKSVDQKTFWRLIRTEAPMGQLVKHARPKQQQQFETEFLQYLEDDRALASGAPHDCVGAHVRRLAAPMDAVLVTAGSNKPARQAVLDQGQLTDLFGQMMGLSRNASQRGAQLLMLADGASDALVIASSETLVRCACSVDLNVVGVSAGTATNRRLMQAGAGQVYGDLAELTGALLGSNDS